MFELFDLSVSLGGRTALAGIDGTLRRGRVTAVLGPNGAGKSTLLQCLAGLRAPTSGRIMQGGRLLGDIPDRERANRLGYLPQAAPLHWNIGVRALVALGRSPRRGRFGPLSLADEAAIDAALAQVDALGLSSRLAGTLSGGELARVHLARVLAGEPEWVLADEPFAALDLAHRLDLADQLRNIAAEGKGVAVVLHDIGLAARLADDILLLDRGRLVSSGTAEEVLSSPRTAEVFGVRLLRHVDADGSVGIIAARRFP